MQRIIERVRHSQTPDATSAGEFCQPAIAAMLLCSLDDAAVVGGYHPVRVGEKYKQNRYVVLKKLGWGHFSTVWLVLDNLTHTFAALKVF